MNNLKLLQHIIGAALFPLLLLGCSQRAAIQPSETPAATTTPIPPTATSLPPSPTNTPTIPPTPTATLIASPTPLPRPIVRVEDVAGVWRGGLSDLEFKEDGSFIEFDDQGTLIVKGYYWFENTQFYIRDTGGRYVCSPRGVIGVYEIRATMMGDWIYFSEIEDRCSDRAAALAGSWRQATP